MAGADTGGAAVTRAPVGYFGSADGERISVHSCMAARFWPQCRGSRHLRSYSSSRWGALTCRPGLTFTPAFSFHCSTVHDIFCLLVQLKPIAWLGRNASQPHAPCSQLNVRQGE